MLDDRIDKLSDVQKRCLRLAAEGRSSKEIAPLVGLTHQTVDQYIHRARVTLGVDNRREAARLLAEMERAGPFKEFELKPATVENACKSGTPEASTRQRGKIIQLLGLPPLGGSTNDLTYPQRLISIGRVALFLTIVVLSMIIIFAAALDAFSD